MYTPKATTSSPCCSCTASSGDDKWHPVEMKPGWDARWTGEFSVDTIGNYCFTVMAWPDHFRSWRRDLEKRVAAAQDIQLELVIGANMMREAAANAPSDEAKRLNTRADAIEREDSSQDVRAKIVLDEAVLPAMHAYAPRHPLTVYETHQRVFVDRERARFSAWYELFPRSTSPIAGKHGTFKTSSRLAALRRADGLRRPLPAAHPPDRRHQPQGPQQQPGGAPRATRQPVGHRQRRRVATKPSRRSSARWQTSAAWSKRRAEPRHGDRAGHRASVLARPPLRQRAPEWFKHRPDGSIQLRREPAQEVPGHLPDRLRDRGLAGAVGRAESVFRFWIEQGVKHLPRRQPAHQAVRVLGVADRATSRRDHPDVLFLAEAFTTPEGDVPLAKLGFTQSYTYFTWRNTQVGARRSTSTELTTPTGQRVLPAQLLAQHAGHPARVPAARRPARLRHPSRPGGHARRQLRHLRPAVRARRTPRRASRAREEYLDSEKYEIKHWDVERPGSLAQFLIARINRMRAREPGPAAQRHAEASTASTTTTCSPT